MDERILKFRKSQKDNEIERQKDPIRMALYESELKKELDINYMGDGNFRHELDVFSPKAGGFLPVIVEIHGGGYIANEKEVTRTHAKYLATQGFHVVNGDYTLCPEADFAQEMQEMSDIMTWVYENRTTYGFDTDHVYLTGDSAGGHLVLLYAMLQGNEKMQEFFHVKMPKIQIKAVAANCPAFQFRFNPALPENGGMNVFLNLVFPNGASDELLDMLDITKLAKISNYPPLIITTTPQDSLLYEDDLRLRDALKETKGEVIFNIYTKKSNELSHVFNVIFPTWEESQEANQDIVRFFRAH